MDVCDSVTFSLWTQTDFPSKNNKISESNFFFRITNFALFRILCKTRLFRSFAKPTRKKHNIQFVALNVFTRRVCTIKRPTANFKQHSSLDNGHLSYESLCSYSDYSLVVCVIFSMRSLSRCRNDVASVVCHKLFENIGISWIHMDVGRALCLSTSPAAAHTFYLIKQLKIICTTIISQIHILMREWERESA